MTDPTPIEATLKVAEDVVEVLRAHGLDAVVIGAMALAAHGYPRETVDFDLAVAGAPSSLHAVAEDLRTRGYDCVVRDPDADDPLGGVLDVRGPGAADLVQVVNFLNPPSGGFPRLVADSVVEASPLVEGSPLRVVDPYHLVAFKLYAGGPKSALDILELLDRNPELDLARLRELCSQYRLGAALEKTLTLVER